MPEYAKELELFKGLEKYRYQKLSSTTVDGEEDEEDAPADPKKRDRAALEKIQEGWHISMR